MFRFMFFKSNALEGPPIYEQPFQGTEEEARSAIQVAVAQEHAAFGQLLREDGLVLGNFCMQSL